MQRQRRVVVTADTVAIVFLSVWVSKKNILLQLDGVCAERRQGCTQKKAYQYLLLSEVPEIVH